MSDLHSVRALLTLYAPKAGGTAIVLPSGSRSLLIEFSLGEVVSQLGAIVIADDGTDLQSGLSDVPVTLQFWADEASHYASPGSRFHVWYGAYIGQGVIEGS